MEKTYYSKIDIWFVLLMGAIYAVVGHYVFKSGDISAAAILVILPFLLFPCKYVLKKDHLYVRCGILIWGKYYYKDIEPDSVTLTYNPLSAPALSLQRVKIGLKNRILFLLISPKNREEFVEELLKRQQDAAGEG